MIPSITNLEKMYNDFRKITFNNIKKSLYLKAFVDLWCG